MEVSQEFIQKIILGEREAASVKNTRGGKCLTSSPNCTKDGLMLMPEWHVWETDSMLESFPGRGGGAVKNTKRNCPTPSSN